MDNNIRRTICSYSIQEDIPIDYIFTLDRLLSPKTKRRINSSGQHYHILAIIFKMAIAKAETEADVDRIVNEKMSDIYFISKLKKQLPDVF